LNAWSMATAVVLTWNIRCGRARRMRAETSGQASEHVCVC